MDTGAHLESRARRAIVPDLLAAVTNALTYIPAGLGYALVAGVNPVYGLYTGITAPIVGALTAGSTFMVVVATNELAIPTGAILGDLGLAGSGPALATLVLLVGLYALGFGLLRLGSLTRFISESVMTGFITGVAVVLILGQLDELTGYAYHVGGSPLVKFWDWLTHLNEVDLASTVVGLATIVLIVALQRTRLKTVALILGLLATSVLVKALGMPSVALVGSVADIPSKLPAPVLPDLTLVPSMLLPAFSLAVVGLSVAAGVSQKYPEPDGSLPDASRGFIGQGAANLVAGLFQGIAAGGSLSRTATNVRAGARSRLANIYFGLLLAIVVLLFGQQAESIPLPALGGLLIVIGIGVISPARIQRVWRTRRSEQIVLLATLLLTLVAPMQWAILAGVALTMAAFIAMSSRNIELVEIAPRPDGQFEELPAPAELESNRATVLQWYGTVFHATLLPLERKLPVPDRARNAVMIFMVHGYDAIGSSGLAFLERYAKKLKAGGNKLMLAGVSKELRAELQATGLLDVLGAENVVLETIILGESMRQALVSANASIATRRAAGGAGERPATNV